MVSSFCWWSRLLSVDTSPAGPVADVARHEEDHTLNRLVPLGNEPVRT